jgi:aflatoxin B1 aldehyde reductase
LKFAAPFFSLFFSPFHLESMSVHRAAAAGPAEQLGSRIVIGASLQLRATAVRCRAGLGHRQQRVQSLERSLVVPLPWPAVGPIARSPCCGPAAATCARSLAGCNQFGTRLADVDGALELMAELGIDELDTARGYGGGESEAALGVALEKIKAARGADALPFIATKAQPPLGYDASVAKLDESLSALRMPSVDLWYLHSPDADASLEDTLRAVGEAHAAAKVKEWGVSNFTAWQVVQVVAYCKEHGIAQPTVYQGSYHVLQRQAEDELLPALRAHGIRYYAYSPLAGGLLTGKHSFDATPTEGRYDGGSASRWGERWWRKELFEAIEELQAVCEAQQPPIGLAAAAIRWAVYHSALSRELGDAVILGASSVEQLASNAECAAGGPLPAALVEYMDGLAGTAAVRGVVPPLGSTWMKL